LRPVLFDNMHQYSFYLHFFLVIKSVFHAQGKIQIIYIGNQQQTSYDQRLIKNMPIVSGTYVLINSIALTSQQYKEAKGRIDS
jgi:hypothetical protein